MTRLKDCNMRLRAILLLLAAFPTGLVAQVGDSASCDAIETRVRNDLAKGHPRTLEGLVYCPVQGAPVLAGLWRDGQMTPEVLAVVRNVSKGIRSPDLFAAVDASARNGGASAEVRLAALQVLIKYVDPRQDLPTAKLATLRPGMGTLWLCVDCGREATDSSVDPALRSRALGTFEALSHDPGPEVGRVATAVLEALARVAPGEISIPSNTVTGSFDCARRELTLTNRSPVTWPMTLRQAGSNDTIRLALPGTWGGKDGVGRLTLASTARVELYLGDRRQLSLECTTKP